LSTYIYRHAYRVLHYIVRIFSSEFSVRNVIPIRCKKAVN
jgi:hypothetical protein